MLHPRRLDSLSPSFEEVINSSVSNQSRFFAWGELLALPPLSAIKTVDIRRHMIGNTIQKRYHGHQQRLL
jgi:hypothetical protein